MYSLIIIVCVSCVSEFNFKNILEHGIKTDIKFDSIM